MNYYFSTYIRNGKAIGQIITLGNTLASGQHISVISHLMYELIKFVFEKLYLQKPLLKKQSYTEMCRRDN